MECFNCDAPLGPGAIICGRCGMEQPEAAPEAAYRPPMAPSAGKRGVGFNDYNAGKKGDGIGGFFKVVIGVLVLGGVAAATLLTIYRFQQNEKRQRTVTEMARMADLIEEYRALNHAYPDVTTIQELDKSLKSIAQKRLMNDFMPQMKGLMPNMPDNPGAMAQEMQREMLREMQRQEAPPESYEPSNPDIYYDPLGLNKPNPAPQPRAAPSEPATGSDSPGFNIMRQGAPAPAPSPRPEQPAAGSAGDSPGFNIMKPIAPAKPARSPAPQYEIDSPGPAYPDRMPDRMVMPEIPEMPVMAMPPNILGNLKIGGIQLQDSWSHDYRYVPTTDGYLLISAGGDGRFESENPADYKKKPADSRPVDFVIQNGKWLQAPTGTPGF